MAIKRVKSKSGKIYTYDYTHKSTRGLTLVGKGGRIDKKNIKKFKDIIDATPGYSLSEKIYLKADLDNMVKLRHKQKKKLTTTGFLGQKAKDDKEKMFINAGYSVDEVAAKYGVPAHELLDPANWVGDTFTSPSTGKTYTFRFTYQGEILV